jgi:hypothetical protein
MVTLRKSPKSKRRRELFSAPGYCPPGPIRRIERTYSRRRKQEALLFLVHHRIPMQVNYTGKYLRPSRVSKGMADVKEEVFRRPTTRETAQDFRITNHSTIFEWWTQRDKIFGNKSVVTSCLPKWPALEKTLVEHFTAARAENKIVTVH